MEIPSALQEALTRMFSGVPETVAAPVSIPPPPTSAPSPGMMARLLEMIRTGGGNPNPMPSWAEKATYEVPEMLQGGEALGSGAGLGEGLATGVGAAEAAGAAGLGAAALPILTGLAIPAVIGEGYNALTNKNDPLHQAGIGAGVFSPTLAEHGDRWSQLTAGQYMDDDEANAMAKAMSRKTQMAASPAAQAVSNTVKANTPTGSQPVPLDGAKGPASASPDPQMAWLKEQLKKGSKPQDIGGELFHRIAGPTSSYNAADPRAIHANQLIEKAYGGITGGDVLSKGGLPIGISSSGAYPFGHMTDSANALSDSVGQSPMFRGDFLSRRDDQPQSIRTEARF